MWSQAKYYLNSLQYHFNDKTLEPIAPTLKPGEKLHIPIHQDESIAQANELQHCVWAKNGNTPLCKKSPGQSQHMSAFATELTGPYA